MDYLESRSLNDAGEKKKKKGVVGKGKERKGKFVFVWLFCLFFLGGGGSLRDLI